VHALRAHYADDEELTAIADFIEYWSARDAKLEQGWPSFATPRVQKGALKYVIDVKK
jgi:hypothetical protein